MLLLDQQRRADVLVSPGNAPLPVTTAVVKQAMIQLCQIDSLRHRHPVISAEVAGLSFHAALLMPFGRGTELAVETPMRAERDEPRRLFPALSAQDLLYRCLEIVVLLCRTALCSGRRRELRKMGASGAEDGT